MFRRSGYIIRTYSLSIKINYPDKTLGQITTLEIYIYKRKKEKPKLILGDQEKGVLQGLRGVHSRTFDKANSLVFLKVKCTGFESRETGCS